MMSAQASALRSSVAPLTPTAAARHDRLSLPAEGPCHRNLTGPRKNGVDFGSRSANLCRELLVVSGREMTFAALARASPS